LAIVFSIFFLILSIAGGLYTSFEAAEKDWSFMSRAYGTMCVYTSEESFVVNLAHLLYHFWL